MAAPKLTDEQREMLLEWLAADYGEKLIRHWFTERGWPQINKASFSHHRSQHRETIDQLRIARRDGALNRGLAVKEERVARLAHHADELDEIKWLPDEKGRLWNEKSWRETLDDIAREMGHRKAGVELTGKDGAPIEIATARDRLREKLSQMASRAKDNDEPSDG